MPTKTVLLLPFFLKDPVCFLFSVLVRYLLGESISYHVITYIVDCHDSTVFNNYKSTKQENWSMINQPLMLTSLSPAVELAQVHGEFSSLS